MARFWMSEYSQLPHDKDTQKMQMQREPAIARQSESFASTIDADPFDSESRYVRIVCDVDAYYNVGPASQVADINATPLFARQKEWFAVTPGHILSITAA